MNFFTVLSALALSTWAILPESQILTEKSQPCLPNLLKLNSIFDLSPKWTVKDNLFLEEGRLVMKEGAGSIWSKNVLSGSKQDWTVEVVFRNSERVDTNDHKYFDSNGFSLWLLESAPPYDNENYGGPKSYDGLHFLINNRDARGLKIFVNDGLRIPANSIAEAVGECDINYLDSMIPFTLRVSYSSKDKIFKVQVDNNLCFRTDLLSFDQLNSDFYIGISASADKSSEEYWELFRLDSFNELTEDAVDDHDFMEGDVVKMVTITKTDDSTATKTPPVMRESLIENARAGFSSFDYSRFDSNIDQINQKLSLLEKALDKFDNSEVLVLSEALKELKGAQEKQLAVLDDMKKTHEEYQALLKSHFKEMVNYVGVIHQKVIDEIKIHQLETHNFEAKVDLLMANHRETLRQYMDYAGEIGRKSDSFEFFNSVLRWILLPFFILLAGLSLLVYRLRKDIKHSKII